MSEEKKLYQNIEIKELDNSEVEIKGEITLDAVSEYRPKALKKLSKNTEVPGFRKGHVPENMLVNKLGEPAILSEVAEEVLQTIYPQIVLEHKIQVIGQPQISITKLAPGNPIGFTTRTPVMPKTELPDYKKVAQEVVKEKGDPLIIVTDEDVEKVITQVRENKKAIEKLEELPDLTSDDVKKLGDFSDLDDFKTKLRENIKKDKERKAKEELRMAIVEKIIEKATIPLPKLFVDAEIDKMMHEFKHHIKAMGLSFDDYLKKTDKTPEQIREESRGEAEKRAKLQLILSKIASEEKLEPEQEKVDHEIKHIFEHHKDADPERVRVRLVMTYEGKCAFSLFLY